MSSAFEAALASWRFEPWLIAALVATGWVYVRGWRRLHRDLPDRLPTWRLVAFLAGLATFLFAVASPLDAFANLLLQVHMLQHFLLMMVAPPLLWLGSPELPLLHGLPEVMRRDGLGPFLSWPLLHRVRSFLTHPVVCWLTFAVATWLWHVPALYEAALLDPFWHEVEHVSFFLASLLFWFPVIQPWPSQPRWTRWATIPYLFLASLQMTVFSALFVFADRVIYPIYAAAPRLGGVSALEDQRIAGAVMWVPGSFVLLATTMVLVARLLSPKLVRPGARQAGVSGEARAWRGPKPVDVSTWPLIGALVRSVSGRRAFQGALLFLAVVIALDGVLGPPMGAMNLAGVVPWTYWRGLIVIGLLAAGNLFCFACPFVLPRGLARTLFRADRHWPAALRSKWFAAGLFVVYLWAYEIFSLWDSPLGTAWIILGYFVAAFVVDAVFRGASFCKYVCPIGQFNFVTSVFSPLEVRARSLDVCRTCETQDCIRGRADAPGCDLDLFIPNKVGNLDCTFCMDCVRACPHDNVGVLSRMPGAEMLVTRSRASFGRLHARLDVAALVLVIVLGGFANAAGMVGPVVDRLRGVSAEMGWPGTESAFTLYLLGCVIVLPLGFAGMCRLWSRSLGLSSGDSLAWFCGLALALLPLGIAMWADHVLLHLVPALGTVVPVVTRAAADIGLPVGPPDWAVTRAMSVGGDGLLSIQILVLDVGLLLSLYFGWRIVRSHVPSFGKALVAAVPWGAVTTLLFGVGVWILFQPMEMRGMMMH